MGSTLFNNDKVPVKNLDIIDGSEIKDFLKRKLYCNVTDNRLFIITLKFLLDDISVEKSADVFIHAAKTILTTLKGKDWRKSIHAGIFLKEKSKFTSTDFSGEYIHYHLLVNLHDTTYLDIKNCLEGSVIKHKDFRNLSVDVYGKEDFKDKHTKMFNPWKNKVTIFEIPYLDYVANYIKKCYQDYTMLISSDSEPNHYVKFRKITADEFYKDL